MHFAEELTGRFRGERRALPALAISDPSHLTCVANDYGFEFVFSRYVEAFARPGDVLVALSTSGNSPNILRAAEAARTGTPCLYLCLYYPSIAHTARGVCAPRV
jgi:D-sedoheptulose 7-phosphate isomerase